jgi:signal transduction histidine kinase
MAEALTAPTKETATAKVIDLPVRRHWPVTQGSGSDGVAREQCVRLARDLHDVVGSAMTTINLYALAALELVERNPEEAAEALRTIAESSARSLSEVRGLVASLRHAGPPPRYSPRLARLEELVMSAVAGRLEVEVSVTGAIEELLWTHDEAAYRIVQESVTNVLRHSDATRLEVTVAVHGDELQVDVRDNGVAGGADIPSGCGIAGMRERAELLGGRLSAGRASSRGFGIQACIPLPGRMPGGELDAC